MSPKISIQDYLSLDNLLEWTAGIDNIYNPTIFGLNGVSLLELVYSHKKEVNIHDITIAKTLDHTMYDAIDQYVKQKLPVDEIKKALIEKKSIEIHGVYPNHIKNCENIISNQYKLKPVNFSHNPNPKLFNFVRPSFYSDKNRLIGNLSNLV